MTEPVDATATGAPNARNGGDYPLRDTAAALNERLGLYLSEEQQRGLAVGLLVGVALGAAVFTWGIAGALRRRD